MVCVTVNDQGGVQNGYYARPDLSLHYLVDTARNMIVRTVTNGGLACLSDRKIFGTDTTFRLKVAKPTNGSGFFQNGLIDYKSNGYAASVVGVEKAEGKDCILIKLQKDEKMYHLYYIDKETHLLFMQQTHFASGPDGWILYYSDYRSVDGVMFPFVVEASGGPFKRKTYTSIKTNVSLDKRMFVCNGL
ncbi:MAG: hypothetical protein MUD08_17220 [Cytophagales bacterium]|nr:hypothetical protein [Cytophagales bacterium]